MYQVQRSIWFKPGRLDTWWKNLENGPLDNKVWRLPIVEKSVLLLYKISHYIAPNPLSRGMRAIAANKKLEVTLCYLEDTVAMKMTVNLFRIHQSTLSNIVIEVCNVLCSQLGPKLIYFPKTVYEIMKITSEFEIKYRAPQVFNCIAGTHIPKKSPQANS